MNKEYNKYRELLILAVLRKLGGEATVNEVINFIWDKDRKERAVYKRGWRFYVHLNKFPASMERRKLIKFTGRTKYGETGLKEKIWRVL